MEFTLSPQDINTLTLALSSTYYIYKEDLTQETEDLTNSLDELYSRLTGGQTLS